MEPGLRRRIVTFKCGAKIEMISRSEADLDEEEAIRSKQDCFHCRINDGTITDEDLDIMAISYMYQSVQDQISVAREVRISQSRIN